MREGQARRKIRIGRVVGDKMEKTRIVAVERLFRHPQYEKVIKRRKKFMVDDPKNESHVGDKVRIAETRPLSKRKRWRVLEVLEKAEEI
ncbi:30S ribosomal protein S17 [bacterium]|nr:30S ribosomal protein S17 [bacterium]NIN92285.1 30S ribosomal protein S17 [bacterium]NIO18407.1 30S ribosomal protein S17 [bacterium]NIO73400.1 30S ribosomal protein S17 [bacterium]